MNGPQLKLLQPIQNSALIPSCSDNMTSEFGQNLLVHKTGFHKNFEPTLNEGLSLSACPYGPYIDTSQAEYSS